MKENSLRNLVLSGFILLKFLLEYLVITPPYELHRDEFLHLDQAHHLAWGYMSVPPVTSWISSIIYFLGGSVFWVKFFPALFGAFTILVVWKAIEALGGSLFSLVLGATAVLFSVLVRLNILYQPNSLDVLLWTSVYFFVLRYIQTRKNKWLFFAAIAFAFGFLNKYNILFLLPGLFVGLLLTENRKIFLRKELYFSILLVLLIISPNLIWQYNNNFPVVHHMKELAEKQLVNVSRIGFLKEQVFFFIGSFFVIIAGFFALLFYPPFKKFRLFFYSLFLTLLLFTVLKAKAYYAIGIYPVYLAFGSVYFDDLLKNRRAKFLKPVLILIPLVIFIPMYQLIFPNKSPEYIVSHPQRYKALGLLGWEDGKDHQLPQDFADMLGWKELAFKVDSVYKTITDRESTLIICDNYGEAGAINYYSKIKNVEASSFNADYINWFDLTKSYTNLIVVFDDNSQKQVEKISPYFQSVFLVASIENPYAREFGTKIYLFLNAKIDINNMIRQKIHEEKNQW
jgi:hypothetical protein